MINHRSEQLRHKLRLLFSSQRFVLCIMLILKHASITHSFQSSHTTAAWISIIQRKYVSQSNHHHRDAAYSYTNKYLSSIAKACHKKTSHLQSFVSELSSYALPPSIPGEDFQTRLRKNQRIVGFGDVHGDVIALWKFLITARVLDPKSLWDDPIWCGQDTIVVQCGDILDRGENELACFRLLASLSRQARTQGGALHILYGNHEALNSVGDFKYTYPKGNYEFEATLGPGLDSTYNNKQRWRLQYGGNIPTRWKALEPGGLLSTSLLTRMHVAMVIGRTVFVHGGLTAEHIKKFGGIQGMNDAARSWIIQSHHGHDNDQGNFTSVKDVLASAEYRAQCAYKSRPECLSGGIGSPSPVWMRDYSLPSDKIPRNPKAQAMIDECLMEIGHGVQRMVMGHTPQKKINAALEGRAWRVDVGASAGVQGGTPECLEIIHGGDDHDDIISILTWNGQKTPAKDRFVWEELF